MKPQLVLLPGMLCDRGYYEPQLAALQSVADVSIPSYPFVCSISEMAERVLQQAPPRFAVVGHSMGGRVAQEIVARAPERVTGLGLCGTDYHGFQSPEERAGEEARRIEWLALVDRIGFAGFAAQWAPRLVASTRRNDHELLGRIARMAEGHGARGLDAHCRAGLSRPDHTDLLGHITVPTLLIAGSEDSFRTPALHQDFGSRIPGARVAIIEGAGHMMSMEAPAAVNAHMLLWLATLRA
jgi:pimeloyl-ACP methyl ester carboxylesterase